MFEVAKAHGLHTAWSDKHMAYELVNCPSGAGARLHLIGRSRLPMFVKNFLWQYVPFQVGGSDAAELKAVATEHTQALPGLR